MIIPRYDEAQVQQNVLPTPQMSGASPVGRGMADIGGALGQAGGEAFDAAMEAKHRSDTSAVMESQVSFNKKVLDLQTQALQRKGHEALDNKGMYAAFDQAYKEQQGLLKNDTQRDLFSRQTANDRNQFSLSIERHAAEQGHALNVANASALIETDMQKLSTLYRDPNAFEQQLKVAKAHKLDQLHMMGLSDSDEAAKAELDKLHSVAVVDRIKQMMTDNPSEAQHLYEVHQDEIAPHEREALKHSVSVVSEQKAGIDAAEALTGEILQGQKSYSELRSQLYSQLKDKPGAFKIAEQQLRGNYQAAKEDRAELVANLAGSVEKMINDGIAHDKPVTPKDLAQFPEYQALIKNGSKEAMAEASRFMGQAYREKHEAEREKQQAVREARAEERDRRAERRQARMEQKQAQLELASAYDDPDILTNASPAQIKKLAPQIGYVNVQKLMNNRRKYLKDDTALQNAKVDRDVLVAEMSAADLKYEANPSKAKSEAFQKTAQLKMKVQDVMRWEAERTGKPVTPERQREIVRDQLLKVHVRAKGFFGEAEDEKMQFEAEYPENFVVSGASAKETQTVVDALRKRGIAPTFAMVQEGVKHLKGGR